MIADWREKKGMGDFAFMTVQLPPSVDYSKDPSKEMGTGRMQIRLAEAEASPHPNGLTDISGVAVSLDCGGKSAWGWDHPPNKNEISRRLALQTVHAAFAQQGRINNAIVCPASEPSCNTSSIWTGPLMSKVSAAKGDSGTGGSGDSDSGTGGYSVTIDFEDFSAEGMKLTDVLSTNPDGTTNNCSARPAPLPSCCAHMPPFELWTGASWVRIGREQITINGPKLQLELGANASSTAPTRVRYAWADYVDCVLVNSDGLPAGPFVANVSSTRAAETREPTKKLTDAPTKEPTKGLIQSPPLGTNTWWEYSECIVSV
jgi:hypothetical protein